MSLAPDSDDDDAGDHLIFTSRSSADSTAFGALRTRFGISKGKDVHIPKGITTVRGQLGAGETETEADEPPKHLPTARIVPASAPLIPPNPLARLTPILFETSRLLSIVPAIYGTLYNLHKVYNNPPPSQSQVQTCRTMRIDYLVCALWAILTGYQCLRLTTGLLSRWRVYYPPLATLIRLLALQAICWPAHHLTLVHLDHTVRPLACWAAVGSTTCLSRAVQIWATSNLWLDRGQEGGREREPERRWAGGRWGGRRWDWGEVGVQCALPMGVVYVAMAWALVLKGEWGGC